MKARVIVQTFPNGQKNICFTQDPLTDLTDYLVKGERSEVIQGEVFILTDNSDLGKALLETELRSVDNVDQIVPYLGVV